MKTNSRTAFKVLATPHLYPWRVTARARRGSRAGRGSTRRKPSRETRSSLGRRAGR